MFSSESWSSISLATVTPSLVIVGEPNFFSMTTLRPFGPSVTLTASASLLTPLRIDWRASSPYVTRFAIACVSLPFDDREHFVLAENRVLDVVELDVGAGVLADQDGVALLDVQLDALAVVVELSFADRDHFRFLRLLFRGVGDDDPSANLLLCILPTDHDPVVEGAKLEVCSDCCHVC